MKRPLCGGLLLVGIFLFPAPCVSQTTEDLRRIEEKARQDLERTEAAILEEEKRFVLDYGIWINHLYSDFTDDDNDPVALDTTDTTFASDQRLWVRATLRPPATGSLGNEQSVYLRVKNKNTWRTPADANGNHDQNGPHLDYGFLSLNLQPFFLQLGRRLYGVGQGIAYSNLHDGAELAASFAQWSWAGLLTRTLPHEDNLDLSVPGGKKSGRTFAGLEGKYIGIPNHGLYGYALFQRDDGEERPTDAAQDFDYDSDYFGLGSEGKLLANLRYAAEVILQRGKSFTSSTNQRRNIRAWGMDVSMTYDAQLPTQPTLSAEYAFGSGDSDRTNVTDTVSGNSSGLDTNFLYFGYLPTGYALSPRLSNLRMYKMGVALKPMEKVRRLNLKGLSVGLDLYRYEKDEPKGGIFDSQASNEDREVGHELDLTLSWPILSDLALAVEYGHFWPGSAYPDPTNDSAEYFSVGVTNTF